MVRLREDGAGYTLIELMMVVAIVGVVSSMGYLAMNKITRAQLMAESLSSIQQGAFTSFDTISKLLRQAGGSTVTIDRLDSDQPPWSRITFTNPNNGRSFSFYQKGQFLYIGSVPAMKDLRRLTFSYPNSATSNVISVSMTFEKSTGSGQSKAVQLFLQKIKIQN